MLQWDPAFATAYQIQVSPDGGNWTTIYSTTTGTGFKETLTVNGTGRYVRMYGTARATTYGYSLWEFQVYGTGGSPVAPPAPPPNVTFPATRLVFDDEFNDAGRHQARRPPSGPPRPAPGRTTSCSTTRPTATPRPTAPATW